MTLTKRISLIAAAAIALCTGSIALLAAVSGKSTALNQVDRRLIALRKEVETMEDPVSALLQSVASSSGDFTASLVVVDEDPIALLDESTQGSIQIPSMDLDQLTIAGQNPISLGVDEGLRLVALDVGDQQWLVFGESIADIQERFSSQLLTNSLLAVVLTAFGGLLAGAITRRSMAPLGAIVKYSRHVASGHLGETLHANAPSSEVRELQTSIASMVSALKDAADVRARSETAMRDFLADVAHELRTPLTTVRAYADLLASERPADAETRARAQTRIAQESKRMGRLIDDLLLLARLSAAPAERSETVDIFPILKAHLGDLEVLDPNRPIIVNAESTMARVNRNLLERMFANIVSNIHRHSPPHAQVAVAMKASEESLEITFDDAGPGLDDHQLTQVMNGTKRFGTLRVDNQHGTGLGLHLVASIARAHGGEATFERSSLGGLRVRIRMPVAAPVGESN